MCLIFTPTIFKIFFRVFFIGGDAKSYSKLGISDKQCEGVKRLLNDTTWLLFSSICLKRLSFLFSFYLYQFACFFIILVFDIFNLHRTHQQSHLTGRSAKVSFLFNVEFLKALSWAHCYFSHISTFLVTGIPT